MTCVFLIDGNGYFLRRLLVLKYLVLCQMDRLCCLCYVIYVWCRVMKWIMRTWCMNTCVRCICGLKKNIRELNLINLWGGTWVSINLKAMSYSLNTTSLEMKIIPSIFIHLWPLCVGETPQICTPTAPKLQFMLIIMPQVWKACTPKDFQWMVVWLLVVYNWERRNIIRYTPCR